MYSLEVSQEWSAEFVQQAAAQFEENFARLLTGGDPSTEVTQDVVQEKLKQMAGILLTTWLCATFTFWGP